jgi:hypothetical protein
MYPSLSAGHQLGEKPRIPALWIEMAAFARTISIGLTTRSVRPRRLPGIAP